MERHGKKIGNTLRFLIPVLIATALWGSASPGVKFAFEWLAIDADNLWQQMYFAGLRFIPAGLMVLGFALVSGKRIRLSRGEWPRVLLMSATQIFFYYTIYFYGLAHTSSVRAAILNATSAFFSVGVAHMIGMEKLTARRAIGCAAGFAGIVVMQAGGGGAGGPFRLAGEGMMLLGAVMDGVAKLISKRAMRDVDASVANGWQLTLGGAAFLVFGLLGGGRFGAAPAKGIACLAYLAFLSAMAFTLWMWLLKNYSVGNVVVCSFLTPVFGALFTAIFRPAENAFSARNVIALALISFGVIIVNLHAHHGHRAEKA